MCRSIRRLFAVAVIVSAGNSSVADAENYVGFRGPGSTGVAEASDLPAAWSETENIVWKCDLPGLGASCPTIIDGKIYLTCYSGYAESIDEPGDQAKLMRHVVCVDRGTGDIVWTKDFVPKLPESNYRPDNDARHGYASSTITTDGERLYVFFGASGMYCLDMNGEEIWHVDLGSGTHGWGSGASPLLVGDMVIVNASIESKSLVALDKRTGDEIWRVGGIDSCWSTPVLVDAPERQEIVLNVPNVLKAFDPATGNELWHCQGMPDGYLVPTVTSEDGVVYVIGARKNTAAAVRAGGSGDVTDSNVLWRVNKGSNVSSPVYVDGHVYFFQESKGIAYCLDAATGDVVYQERLEPRPGLIYSSPLATDGKLYAVSQENGTYVLAAKPEFELLAVNKLGDADSESIRSNASIAEADNQLFLRNDDALYCIGTVGMASAPADSAR
ncbi:MAG: PQQ-binding-like beta-propeller repeat protein [Planctomycetales bacterium]|nr:PQQ-binding-like beta-propeller repeat protein [Planctomycetales bacterium]